jgi:hypothetical protein
VDEFRNVTGRNARNTPGITNFDTGVNADDRIFTAGFFA